MFFGVTVNTASSNRLYKCLLFIFACFAFSCSNTKFLTQDQILYTGVKKIDVQAIDSAKVDVIQNHIINSTLAVKPNNPLGSKRRSPFPIGLWVYNYMKPKKEKGFKHFIYKRLAKEPILISDIQADLRVQKVEASLFNSGSFNTKVSYQVFPHKRNPKKAKIAWNVILGATYTYREINYPKSDDVIDSIIGSDRRSSYLKEDARYNLDDLKSERARIADMMRNAGYYYFKPEYVDFLADTIGMHRQVDITVSLKEDTPQKALEVWRINDINIYLGENRATMTNSLQYSDMNIHSQQLKIRPTVIYQNVMFRSGERYSSTAQNHTVSNISSLGVFKYVNLRFEEVDSTQALFNLDLQAAYLSPVSAELELDGVWESNDLAGPEVIAMLRHNNLFRGGEALAIKLNGSYEWLVKGANENGSLNTYEVGLNLSLTLPRTYTFGLFNSRDKRWYRSRTSISIGVDLVNRPKYFQMITYNTEFNYEWRTSQTMSHSFSPFKVTFSSLLSTTEEFRQKALENPAVALSFSDQCIPEILYKFTFDKTYRPLNRNRLFWQASGTAAGNLVYLAKHAFYKDSIAKRELFKRPYSQFAKVTSDLRYFYTFGDRRTVAMRLYGGAAIPYGNSVVIPYTEQFYSGGANSLRAFNVRSIGPGTYHPNDTTNNSFSYWDQTGDIKFEANAEYRFPMGRKLYGAVFLDVGNIWLYKNDPMRPGGEFDWTTFYKQLAVGSGFGFRYDLSFLLLRADVGVPIHTPYAETASDKYYNIPNFWKGLTLYIAIGYPF